MNILLDIEYNETHLSGEKKSCICMHIKKIIFFLRYVEYNRTPIRTVESISYILISNRMEHLS